MKKTFWDRAIILIDMNAFFASVEQLDDKRLRHKPVAVTNSLQGSCIITSSYEARAHGIKTGMSIYEARKKCPRLIQRSARPDRYIEISKRIMNALYDITPDIEIFSIDEAFLDITSCQKLLGPPEEIAKLAHECVWQASHLPSSLGLSGDKTTAKYAAKCNKPEGFTVIPPWEAKRALRDVPVTELCGINKGIAGFLAQYHVYFCGDIERIPISVLAQRFGNIGRRIWYMCQGADPDMLHTTVRPPKTMGHGKVLPPYTLDFSIILTYLQHMSERLATRLRQNKLASKIFWVGLHAPAKGWLGKKIQLPGPTNDGNIIYQAARIIAAQCCKKPTPIRQVQITALDPRPIDLQGDLFLENTQRRDQINHTVDNINQRYGEFNIAPARMMLRSSSPNVIAPGTKHPNLQGFNAK
jgi:DNA polymerase IV